MISERWKQFSLAQQMGNIGSEISRMISLQKIGDSENSKKAFLRALELIDLTIADKRWKNRLHEVLRLREVVCDLFMNTNIYNVSSESLKEYFLHFALLAQNRK